MAISLRDKEERQKDIIFNHLAIAGVVDEKISEVISNLSRDIFLEGDFKEVADSDSVIFYSKDRFLLDMVTLGNMLSIAQFINTDKVLVVGSGLGYASAILSKFVTEVVCLEEDISLIQKSQGISNSLAINNITFVQGTLDSFAYASTFNRVFFEGAFAKITDGLMYVLDRCTDLVGVHRENNLSQIVVVKKVAGEIIKDYYKHTATPFLKGFEEKEEFIF